VETSLHTSGDASKQEHSQGGAGTQTGSSLVLDVAEWLRVFAVVRVRFVRGTARYRTSHFYGEAEKYRVDECNRDVTPIDRAPGQLESGEDGTASEDRSIAT
jgi:hypothetical protein